MLPSLIARRGSGARLYDDPDLKAIHFSCMGLELLVCCLTHRGSTGVFLMLQFFSDVGWHPVLSIAMQAAYCM